VWKLWAGEVPLAQAFWTWAVVGALIVNSVTTFAFLLLIMADKPVIAVLAGYAFSVPYNIIVGVGVWRSAANYLGNPHWSTLARMASVTLLLVLSLT
jgi:hypothetical protein